MKKINKKNTNKRHKIIMKIGEALKKMKKDKLPKSPFQEELKKYPSNYWLVEGDEPNEKGKPQFFIVEDNPRNNELLSGHTPIDLNEYV
jgi:hypothetical protein